MNLAALITTLAHNEVRLRMRRLSTMLALLAVVAISWAMIGDPSSGSALLAVDNARVLYTSSALALGSAALGGLLFGLGGFYLVRGRMGEDLRSGIGSVIGACAVHNGPFLAGRWLGGVAYLSALALGFMGTMLACHALRGDGPIQLSIYLQTYALMLVPMIFFGVSCAILFDSFAPLMGKAGDLLFFLLWSAQLAMLAGYEKGPLNGFDPLLMLDFFGIAVSMVTLTAHLHSTNLMLGGGEFDALLAPVTLPVHLWPARMIVMRCASLLLALLPVLPAAYLFHRFSPDRVRASSARQRRSPLAVVNGWLRPLARLVQPLFQLAARVPGMWGQVLADLALTLVASPSAILVLIAMLAGAVLLPASVLPGLLIFGVGFWAVSISDLSTRDYQADAEDLTGALMGGGSQRYLRQLAATILSGWLFMGVIALRWLSGQPLRAAALVVGVLCLAALATLSGRCSRTSRTFLALFLFGFYVALNAKTVPMLDLVGFNGAATAESIMTHLAVAIGASLIGFAYNRQRAV